MKRFTAGVCVLALVISPISAQENSKRQTKTTDARETSAASGAESTRLPVRRVVLYKNGVGYFEHLGRVRGSQDVHVDFTSAQLNDVLKSLTVLDLSGGRITGVDYNSEAPLARRLATLRLALGERPTVAEFLGALRGSAEEKALLQRYTKQLDDQETQLASLRKKITDTEAQRDAENEKLEKMIEDVNLEATL